MEWRKEIGREVTQFGLAPVVGKGKAESVFLWHLSRPFSHSAISLLYHIFKAFLFGIAALQSEILGTHSASATRRGGSVEGMAFFVFQQRSFVVVVRKCLIIGVSL